MSRVIMVSLAFAPSRVITECLRQVYKTIGLPTHTFEHYVLHQHYPIDKDRNDSILKTLFESYGIKQFDLGANVGLSAGYNYLIQQANITEDDIVIGLDLDVWPTTQGWGEALVKVLAADKKIGWLSLMNQHAARELPERGYTTHTVANTICYEGHAPCVQSIIGWSGKSLLGLKELKEQNKYYGGMEVTSYPRLKALGLKWYYMPQYEENFNSLVEGDRCYIVYKWNYAHLRNTKLSFEEWLNEDPKRLDIK